MSDDPSLDQAFHNHHHSWHFKIHRDRMDARNHDGLEIAPEPSLINQALKPKVLVFPYLRPDLESSTMFCVCGHR